jgi:chemotaxis protein methyltransferase CheR
MNAELTPGLFAIWSALVEERVGIHYRFEEREIFASKLAARAEEAGFQSLLDYYYFIRYDDGDSAEFDALLDALVVNETYLFREAESLRVLVQRIIAPRARAGGFSRVWCAACSSGEEPYTLAMLLEEEAVLDRVEVVASDVSRRALERARRGMYRGRSLRALGEPLCARWFRAEEGGVAVVPRIREKVDFRRVNLMDREAIERLGVFDAIVCRNVLIYFADATVIGVIENLSAVLRPSGHLLVGASESLLRFGTMLRCEERDSNFFYVKVGT